MTELQEKAMKSPVHGNAQEVKEKIQEAWNKPRLVNLDKKRAMLVSLYVIKEGNKWLWCCAVRIANKNKPACKLTSMWMNFEKISARGHSVIELEDVGGGDIEEIFYDYAYARYKPLTEQEVEDLNFIHNFVAEEKIDA